VTDPTRLIDLEEGTTSLERRVLDAGRGIGAPAGAKASVLAAISAQAVLSTSAAAATAVKSSSLALVVKAVAAGMVFGVAATAGVSVWLSPATAPPATPPAPSRGIVAHVAPDSDRVRNPTAATTAPLEPATKAELASRHPIDRPSSSTEPPASPAPAAPSQMAFSDPPLDSTTTKSDASVVDRAHLESRRVAEARGLLRAGRTAAGLVVLNELTREFPNGVLTQEREALTIEALIGSGERERARSLALDFLQRHPTSPLAASVRRALE
jgi:hypothetical protein